MIGGKFDGFIGRRSPLVGVSEGCLPYPLGKRPGMPR